MIKQIDSETRIPYAEVCNDWQPNTKLPDPLYNQLAKYIRNDILAGDLLPGDKLPSTTVMCSTFDVAIDTVQKSLTILNEEGFIERIPKRGTFVTDRSGRESVCLMVGQKIFTNENLTVQAAIFSCFQQVALDAGIHVETKIILDDQSFDSKIARVEKDIDLDRFGLACVLSSNTQLTNWLQNTCRIPFVQSSGSINIYNLGYRGINYLIEQGYKDIKVILGLQKEKTDNPAIEGILDAFNDRGVDTGNGVFIETERSSEKAGYKKIHEMCNNGGIHADCLFSLNDNITRGVILGLMEAGKKIPHDIGLLTHANKQLEILSPVSLTRLEIDPMEFANAMLKNCFKILNNQETEKEEIKFKLVKGDSC